MAFDSGSFREFAVKRFTRSTQTKRQSCRSLQGLSNGIKHINLILSFYLKKWKKSWTAKPVQRLQNLHISRALNGIKFKCDKRKVVAITDRTGMKWHHRKVQWIFLMKFHLKLSRPTEFGSRFLFQETSESWNKWPFFFLLFLSDWLPNGPSSCRELGCWPGEQTNKFVSADGPVKTATLWPDAADNVPPSADNESLKYCVYSLHGRDGHMLVADNFGRHDCFQQKFLALFQRNVIHFYTVR